MTQQINSSHISTEQQRLLEELLRAEGIDITVGQQISRRRRDEPLPLSFAQQRLWFLDQFEPGSNAYNMTKAYHLLGDLNQPAIERSLTELFRRHESLRTTFASRDGQPWQIISEPAPFKLAVMDLSGHPPAQREAMILSLVQTEAERPFDLTRGPLFRAGLLRLAEREHVFYMNMHHIVSDGWSMNLLFKELSALYAAALRDQTASLPELPIQYADYAVWQREWLAGERLDQQLAYWRKQLAGIPAVLELPADHPRPAHQSYRGHTHRIIVNQELVTRLKRLSQQSGCTLFMTLLAAFKVLLHRYTTQKDVVVGTPVAGRDRRELEGLIGFFVNTLVLRTDLSGNPSFAELLSRTRETCLEAYAHQELPFEKLVEELQPERSLGHMPLCQVAFSLQSIPPQEFDLRGLQATRVDFSRESAKFDLMLSLGEEPTGLVGTLQYTSDLFEPATIERMAAHYQQLLAAVVSHPEQKISQLKMLSPDEEHQLLVEWNSDRLEHLPTGCLHEQFEKQVAQTPEAIALISETTEVTYLELNNRANQLAHYLKSLGVGPEQLVGVCVERSVEMVAALLGVWKAGAAYVPIDPKYPRARIGFMLEDAEIKVLITQQSLLELSRTLQTTLVSLDGDRAKIAEMHEHNPENTAVAENLAYIIYTSGSTGRPKGIAITHANALVLLAWTKRYYTTEDLNGVLASTSICFDISIFELFGPLSTGGKVILAENALSLPKLPAANQVMLIDIVPSAMTELLRMNGVPPSVRIVNLPGEPLSAALVQQVFEQENVEKALNLYGPSEDTTFSTYAVLTRDDDLPPSVGRPLPNKQVYILDEHLQLLPLRVPGEVYISGDGVSRGYFNRPGQTAARYLPNPFATNGARMYRTGDLGRYRPDGQIECLGRIDHQVKVRGFRIELGEIEAVLAEHEQTRESVVVAREDGGGTKQVVAYVVADQETFSVSELRNYLKERLPDYMIPSIFVRLDSLPSLPNGKVDRNALPDPGVVRSTSEDGYRAPQTPVEQVLASIWAGLLRVERVGVNDNFFELGGHSLLATQLVSRIRDLLLVELPLRTLFEAPTLGMLSEALTAHEVQAGRTEKIARILLRVKQASPEETASPE